MEQKHGICAPDERGVIALMNSNYNVRAIKIIPKCQQKPISVKRKKADKERIKIHITYQKEIINSFLEGGKEKAVKELAEFIKKISRGGGL